MVAAGRDPVVPGPVGVVEQAHGRGVRDVEDRVRAAPHEQDPRRVGPQVERRVEGQRVDTDRGDAVVAELVRRLRQPHRPRAQQVEVTRELRPPAQPQERELRVRERRVVDVEPVAPWVEAERAEPVLVVADQVAAEQVAVVEDVAQVRVYHHLDPSPCAPLGKWRPRRGASKGGVRTKFFFKVRK